VRVVAGRKAHELLHGGRRVFSNLTRWAKGSFHGLRKRHVQRYLGEFVFRWNRRRHMHGAFKGLLGIGVDLAAARYRDFVEQRARADKPARRPPAAPDRSVPPATCRKQASPAAQ